MIVVGILPTALAGNGLSELVTTVSHDFVLRSDAKLQFLQYAQGQFLVT